MGPSAGLEGCKKFRPNLDFFYVTLLDLRGSYIRVQNVLVSYGSQEACPLHSTKHVSSINGFCW